MTLPRAHDALVGRSLGEFVLRECIGEGGFGAVYRAIQPALDREAVIKVLHTRLHTSKTATERFLREARLASKLDHPYAAHVYAFGAEPDGELWIAMELVRGTPLDKVLKLQGTLTLERLVPLLDRICEVVHTAHEQGIVHRDLKPANVMVLARAGRLLPKLLDFGIAKLATQEDLDTGETQELGSPADGFAQTMDTPVEGLTQRGMIMGSPPYMAPEQWLDAGQVDARTDQYALGILIYECLTGKPPFVGTTITAIATAHASATPPPLGPRFPSALDKVIARALAKDAAARYPDALALATAVRQASGIVEEVQALPALATDERDATVNGAPQPIAEAIAGFETSRNGHQARDALVLAGRTIARYLGLLALACRSRVSDDDGASEAIRTLYRRAFTDREWIELARQLTRPWVERRDAYPIPELVGAFHDGGVAEYLETLVGLREAEATTDDAMRALLVVAIAHANLLLEAISFLRDYPLVVTGAGGYAERWMGARRNQRATIAVRGKGLPVGVPAILDREGAPVLALAPLFQISAPTPGAPLELFAFEGRDRRGAKLVALPAGFEIHDDALWDWFRAQLADSLDETESTVADEKPPYRGLAAFSTEDNALFVGRERQVDAFVNRLKLTSLLAVVGRSGAGKSSFVHAGVVPALPVGWRAVTLRPGPSPVGALIARLEHAGITAAPEWTTNEGPRASQRMPVIAGLREVLARDRDALGHLLRADAARHGPLLLVIDQLEEMFTLCSDEDERRIFAEALAAAARSTEDPVRVVCTLRDDFLVRVDQIPAFRSRIGQGLQLLTVPAAEDLRRILVEPARRVGYELEGDLADEMVKEVADQPGALALISFTASKLWELRDRQFKQLTRTAYKTLGGVGGALGRHAELTLDGMPAEERALTREAFRHLVTSSNTRAVLLGKELRQILGGDAHADGVIEKLVSARLLVAAENEQGDETIEVIHEALLTSWPRLVEWRLEDSAGTRFREQLRSAAKQWDERGRAKGLLWRGDALADLTRWRGRQTAPLTDVETAFTDASLTDVVRGRRRLRLVVAVAFAALLAGVIVLVIFNARAQRDRALALDSAKERNLTLQRTFENEGRRLVLAEDPLHALAYLDAAREIGAKGRSHDLLVAEALQQSSGVLLEIKHSSEVQSPRFSSDGKRLLTAGHDRVARIWDASTGAQLLELRHEEAIVRASFSPDDATVLTGALDNTASLWDARTGKRLHQFSDAGRCARYGDGIVLTVGKDKATVWELPEIKARFEIAAPGGGMCSVSRAAIAVGSGDGITHVWDARTGAQLAELRGTGDITGLAFSPDGARVAVGSSDGTARVWSIATGALEHTLVHTADVEWVEFSPDGTRLATASRDRSAAIWDVATGGRVALLSGHDASVIRAVFSPDGTRLVTASRDGTAWLWNVALGEVEAKWHAHLDAINDVAFDRAGTRVVTASDDARAIIWKVEPQEPVTWLVGHKKAVLAARFSPAGDRIVTASADATVRTWTARGEPLRTLETHGGASDAAFSPDDKLIATAGEDGSIELWDASTGQRRRTLATANPSVYDGYMVVAWSPDGTSLAAAGHDGAIRAWNTASWERRFEIRGHDGYSVFSVSFAPDSRSILTAGGDRTVRTWDLDGKQLAARPDPKELTPASESLTGAIYAPTAGRALSIGMRQRVTIWDVGSQKVTATLIGHAGSISDAAWSPDGAYVITASADNTARIWDTETGDALAVYRYASAVFVGSFSPDGTRFTIGRADGRAAIHALPRYSGDATELARSIACRVPFQIENARLRPRERSCR